MAARGLRRKLMKLALTGLVAVIAVTAFGTAVLADTKKCPEGKVYSDAKGKCVTPRGS